MVAHKPPELAPILAQVVSGNLAAFDALLESGQGAIVAASRLCPKLKLKKESIEKILRSLLIGDLPRKRAQVWASFMRRGYVPSLEAKSIQPVEIEFDQDDEPLLVYIVDRLDQIGDSVDGTISEEEILQMLRQLGHEPPSRHQN